MNYIYSLINLVYEIYIYIILYIIYIYIDHKMIMFNTSSAVAVASLRAFVA
jgi:hypothetical protein